MAAEAAVLSRSWTVGRYTATLTVPRPKHGAVAAAVIEWDPDVPQRLTDEEMEQYRRGRNAALEAMSKALGIRAAVIDL